MRIQSLLIGAAIAAIVILPAHAGEGWVTGQWQTYNTKRLDLENVVATVKVDVKDSGPMAVQVSGLRDRVNGVKVYPEGGKLKIECQEVGTVWDWRHWFDFSQGNLNKPSQLVIHVVVPRGSPVDVEAMAGNVTIGDTMGPLKFEVMGYSESTVGNVSEASLEMSGSGKLKVGNVSGTVHAETAGSGDIRIGNVGKLDAEVDGSGSISAGRVGGPVKADIGGSGSVSVANVAGPLAVNIGGSGELNPLHVNIAGSGDVTIGGTVVDPRINTFGSGTVKAKACRGSSCNDHDLKIGG